MNSDASPTDNGHAYPLYFGPTERSRFGWIHLPSQSAPPRDLGVVLCGPFGYEALCFHRSLRHLAIAATGIGVPAIRFDYDGTGDSTGADLDPDRVAQWIQSIDDAVDVLRAKTGVSRVCVVGIRLGALLAASAPERLDVCASVHIAPISSGRAWLREMKAVQAAMGRPEPPPSLALPEGVAEFVGIRLDREAQDAVTQLDATRIERAPSQVLVIDRDDRAPSAALVARLTAVGSRTEHLVTSGFVEATLDPHEARVPEAMISQVVAFLDRVAGADRLAAIPTAPAPPAPIIAAPGVTEQAVFLDRERCLFGVVSTPTGRPPERALLLLNSGANPHIGNGRMYVTFARRLAEQGWLVLRYDLSGIGDSAAPAGGRENDVYSVRAASDLATAIAYVQERHGLAAPELAGLCSGAYHGFRAAVAGPGIGGLLVINPLVFYWKEGMSLAYPPFQTIAAAERYGQAIRDWSKWRKLLRGEVAIGAAIRVVASRLRARGRSFLNEATRALGVPRPEDLGADLDRAIARGTRVRFVFSEGDPGERLLQDGAGSVLRKRVESGEVHVEHLPNCDHSLSCSWMQEMLWAALSTSLSVRR